MGPPILLWPIMGGAPSPTGLAPARQDAGVAETPRDRGRQARWRSRNEGFVATGALFRRLAVALIAQWRGVTQSVTHFRVEDRTLVVQLRWTLTAASCPWGYFRRVCRAVSNSTCRHGRRGGRRRNRRRLGRSRGRFGRRCAQSERRGVRVAILERRARFPGLPGPGPIAGALRELVNAVGGDAAPRGHPERPGPVPGGAR